MSAIIGLVRYLIPNKKPKVTKQKIVPITDDDLDPHDWIITIIDLNQCSAFILFILLFT